MLLVLVFDASNFANEKICGKDNQNHHSDGENK